MIPLPRPQSPATASPPGRGWRRWLRTCVGGGLLALLAGGLALPAAAQSDQATDDTPATPEQEQTAEAPLPPPADGDLPPLPAEPAPLEPAPPDPSDPADPSATMADEPPSADDASGLESGPGTDPPADETDNGVRYETSSLAFPTPPELFRSLSKAGTTRWRQLYRPPCPDLGADRHRSALGLGTVFADIYLAAEAGDVQQLRNTGQDVVTLGRGLGVGEHLSPVMHELGVMAEKQDWNAVRMRMQRCLDELSDRLHSQRDDDLVILIDLGLWLRVLEISAQAVIEDEDFTRKDLCVGAVAILIELRERHGDLSEAVRADEALNEIGIELVRLAWRWDGRSGTDPSRDDVEASYVKIRNLLRRLLQRA